MTGWFPDRRGMATGMAIMGFGGGAMIGTPLKEFLLRTFWESPQYLGTVESVSLITERGRRFAELSGQTVEVVVAGAVDAGREGVYVIGGFATIPAYLSDVFGNLHVGAIHGRLLAAAFFANLMIRPVSPKHHLKNTHPDAD